MYTYEDVKKGFQLWVLSDFAELPTLAKVKAITDEQLSDLLLASKLYEYLNKKGG